MGSPAGSGRAEYSRTDIAGRIIPGRVTGERSFWKENMLLKTYGHRKERRRPVFYEEEGPYEYGAAEEDLEGKRYKEKEYKETGNKDEQGDLKQKRKKCRKAVGFLAASAIIFLCSALQSGTGSRRAEKRQQCSGLLAADGLFLLVCLWKATAETVDETEEKAEEDEEIRRAVHLSGRSIFLRFMRNWKGRRSI